MARSNGGGGGAFFDLEIQVVATAPEKYTLRAVIYLTSQAVSDSVNDLTVSGGGWWRTGPAALSGAYSATPYWWQDVDVPRQYGAPTTVTVNAVWSAVEFWGTTLSASESYTVPARPWQAPMAPTGVTVRRNSPGSHTVSWTRRVSGTAPYESQTVQRSTDGGAWSTVATVSASATSYTDTGTSAGHYYQWRVVAANGSGAAASAATSIVYSEPLAPTGVTVSRTSDTTHTVSWTRTATTAAPYTSQRVQRWDNAAQTWSTIATVSAGATSYTDTTTVTNRAYAYRVQALNASGVGTSAGSAIVYTSPAAPSSCSAVKSGVNILVSWVGAPAYGDYQLEVYESANGGAWTLLATVAAGTPTYTHAAPSASVTHQYRVRYKTTAGPQGTLYSGYASSAVVQLAAPPSAPTNLGPGGVAVAGEAVTLTWRHNPVDTSPQSKYQVRRRKQGSSTWVEGSQVSTSSASSSVTPSSAWGAVDGETWEWQVRTWGQHADPSPWSATSSLTLSSRPTVAIADLDGATVEASLVTVGWGYYQAEASAQAAWTVELWSGGVCRETRSGAGAATSVAMTTVLPDGSTWTVRARVQSALGLWSAWDEATFGVDYAEPPVPSLSATWDPETASVTLAVDTSAPEGGEVAAESVDVWRQIDDGPWALIATGVPPSSTVTDWSPTVAGTTRYRVDAISAIPSVSTSDEVDVITPQPGDPPGSVWLSAGPGFSQVCRGALNVDVTATVGRERVLRWYAGRSRPVARVSARVARSWQVRLDALASYPAASSPQEWLALAEAAGPHLLRTPDGLYVHGSLSDVTATRGRGGAVTEIAMTFTEAGGDD